MFFLNVLLSQSGLKCYYLMYSLCLKKRTLNSEFLVASLGEGPFSNLHNQPCGMCMKCAFLLTQTVKWIITWMLHKSLQNLWDGSQKTWFSWQMQKPIYTIVVINQLKSELYIFEVEYFNLIWFDLIWFDSILILFKLCLQKSRIPLAGWIYFTHI